ncbi:hypothetical protein D9756_010030 [Leucocoprinus leucothites]|uniref:F-box domain-containing protein n=1 Tax=Leucocoprinus leucothites TaxID=201217 RepID=A0A8H5FRL0_9AGAR|nr:hypothetical protein D9756_010030 [Leucoagaricus leucothites]
MSHKKCGAGSGWCDGDRLRDWALPYFISSPSTQQVSRSYLTQSILNMHTCLQIPELTSMICHEIRMASGGLHKAENRDALLALACTSRSWSSAALDCLWYEIRGMEPLIRCMPQDLWKSDGGRLIFRRPLTDSDLRILHKYTPRIRVFSNISFGRPFADVSVYQTLTVAFVHGGALLPNLEMMDWAFHLCDNDASLPFIRFLLGNRLRSLKLGVNASHPEHLSLLSTLPTISPHISNFEISLLHYSNPPDQYYGLSETLPRWHGITSIIARGIMFEDLFCMASIPNLTSLDIMIAETLWRPRGTVFRGPAHLFHAFSNLQSPFPALKELMISSGLGQPLSNITRLIKIFRGAQLLEFRVDVTVDSSDTTELLPEFSQEIGRHFDKKTLRAFSFSNGVTGGGGFNPTSTIPFSHFTSLLEFSSLDSVVLLFWPPVVITEQEAVRIATSWPNLRILRFLNLSFHSTVIPSPKSPLCALLPLAKGCLNIRILEIFFDASDPSERSLLLEHREKFRGIQNCSLEELRVGVAPISGKEFIAFFLSEVFPCTRIDGLSNMLSTPGRRWRYVGQVLMPLIREARRGYEWSGSQGVSNGGRVSNDGLQGRPFDFESDSDSDSE